MNNRSAMYPSSRTESDPNTPSSFLPHYHPQTPPSPNSTSGSRKPRGSPPARLAGVDPPSRTQQKLWLQRTAALNTSPPDSHGASAVSPSAMDPTFMAAANGRPVPYDNGRGLVLNGGPRTGGAPHGNEAKHLRKAYEKATLELTVVRRFQSPTGNSFARLSSILNEAKGPAAPTRPSSLGKPVKSAPALTLLRDGAHDRDQAASSAELRQLIGRKAPDIKPDDLVHPHAHPLDSTTDLPHRFKSHYPILSTSEETAHDPVPDEDLEEDYPSETDMMIRRMWESREVATSE